MPKRLSVFVLTMMVCGFAFLYVPILLMIVYSFNASRLVTVWDAAHSPTLKWYGELLANGEILDAARLSFRVAALNATGATILGTVSAAGTCSSA